MSDGSWRGGRWWGREVMGLCRREGRFEEVLRAYHLLLSAMNGHQNGKAAQRASSGRGPRGREGGGGRGKKAGPLLLLSVWPWAATQVRGWVGSLPPTTSLLCSSSLPPHARHSRWAHWLTGLTDTPPPRLLLWWCSPLPRPWRHVGPWVTWLGPSRCGGASGPPAAAPAAAALQRPLVLLLLLLPRRPRHAVRGPGWACW